MPYQYKREPLNPDEANRLASACEDHHERLIVWTLPVGSFIRRDGLCGGVVWKGRAGDLACGGTQKNMACHTLLVMRAGVAHSTPHLHPSVSRGENLDLPQCARRGAE